jgi:hypothetical protein
MGALVFGSVRSGGAPHDKSSSASAWPGGCGAVLHMFHGPPGLLPPPPEMPLSGGFAMICSEHPVVLLGLR